MVRTKSTEKSGRRCRVRLKPDTFQRTVVETIINLYGPGTYGGVRYGINNKALETLRDASEKFLEDMWDQVKEIAFQDNHSVVIRKDFETWKNKTAFQRNSSKCTVQSLCKLFESVKKSKRVRLTCVKRGRVRDYGTELSGKDPLVISVQEPHYSQLKNGDKTVDSRPYYPSYRRSSTGDMIMFRHYQSRDSFCVRIDQIGEYPDFYTMLRKETITNCLPDHDIGDFRGAVRTYHSFRNGSYKSLAEKYGVVAFRVSHIC